MAWLAVFFTFALGPLQWITLLDVGLSLKPMHPPFFLASLIGWFRLSRGDVSAELVRAVTPFALFYGLYLSILFLSVLWGGSLTFPIKYAIYFFFAMGFMFLLATYNYNSLMRLLFWSGVAASLFFVGVAAITLASKGVDLFEVVGRALLTGNPRLLQFMVFRNLFNTPESLNGEAIGVALRHTSLGFVYIGFMLAAATARSSFWSWTALGIAASIILLSVSRSLIIAILLAFAPLIFGLMRKSPALMLFTGMFTVLGALLLPFFVDLSGVFQIVDQRFGSLGEDGRVSMYDIALGLVNERPWFGYGAGYYHDFGEHIEHQVHNLFLGAWIQGGIFCLIAALCFKLFLVTLYAKRLGQFFSEPSQICLLGILVLPLFRTQFSGSGGNYNLPEWICIAIVLALFAVAPKRKSAPPPDEPTPFVSRRTAVGVT